MGPPFYRQWSVQAACAPAFPNIIHGYVGHQGEGFSQGFRPLFGTTTMIANAHMFAIKNVSTNTVTCSITNFTTQNFTPIVSCVAICSS